MWATRLPLRTSHYSRYIVTMTCIYGLLYRLFEVDCQYASSCGVSYCTELYCNDLYYCEQMLLSSSMLSSTLLYYMYSQATSLMWLTVRTESPRSLTFMPVRTIAVAYSMI